MSIKPHEDIDRGCVLGQGNTYSHNHEPIKDTTLLLTVIVITVSMIMVSYIILLSPFSSGPRHTSLLTLLSLHSAYGQKVPAGASCNCILDYTASGHFYNNITGITIPKINLLKTQTLPGQTGQGRPISITTKPTQLMGIVTKDFFLGNFTGGPSAVVALNTINVKPNESLGVEIFGGKLPKPTLVKGEIISANVNVNESLSKIKVVGNKTAQFQLLYSKAINKPALGINRFLVSVKSPGYYLVLMSLGYNTKSNYNNKLTTSNTSIIDKFFHSQQARYSLIPIYETVLRVG
jgi:hypothetical protein